MGIPIGQLYKIKEIVLLPIHAQKHKPARNFTQSISNYTKEGRKKYMTIMRIW